MRALAGVLPDRVTAGWNQFLCTALSAIDPRTGQPSVSLTIFQRGGPGAMRGADGYDALGFTGHAGQHALARHGDVRALDAAPHALLRVPARLGRPRRVARRLRHALELDLLRRAARRARRSATTSRPRAPTRPRACSAAGPAGSTSCACASRTAARATGAPRRSSSRSRPEPCASRSTAAAAGTATRAGATRSSCSPRCATACSRARPRSATTASRSRADGRAVDVDADGPPAGGRRVSYRVGIDVGGTFTDFLLVGDDARLVHKTSSTPDDPSRGVVTGLAELAAQLDLTLEGLVARLDLIVHGTTVTTNAVLTRSGARTGLLVDRGLPRHARAARRHARGALRQPARAARAARPALPAAARRRADRLQGRRARAARDRTTCAPRSRRSRRRASRRWRSRSCTRPPSPRHERRARDLVAELMPGAYVTASSDLLPQVRYYDRTSTTVLNAYVGPIIARYLGALTRPPRGARVRRHAADHAVQRRRRHAGRDLRARRAVAALGPGLRADGRAVAARAARPARLHHDRHGRHELRRGAGERTASRC